MKVWKWCVTALLLLAVSTATLPMSAAATEGFNEEGMVIFAAEPDKTSENVMFFRDGVETDKTAMNWVQDPERGNVLSLDGKSEYLKFGSDENLGSKYLKLQQMTFMTWINLKNDVAAEAENNGGIYIPHLMTLYQNADCYLMMSPHAYDSVDDVSGDGRFLNSWYMQFKRTGAEGSAVPIDRKYRTPVLPSEGHYGLGKDEWHHVAITIDERYFISLYIDGRPIDLGQESNLGVNIEQLYADWLLVGRGVPGDILPEGSTEAPFLNALLDDTVLYDKALSAEEIRTAAQINDSENGIYLPTTTAPTYPSTVPTEFPDDKPDAPFGLPMWGFAVCVGLLGFIIVLTVVVNMYEVSWRRANKEAYEKAKAEYEQRLANGEPTEEKKEKSETKADKSKKLVTEPGEMTKKEARQAARRAKKRKDDEEPVLSIKQAALKKRREEHERFLEEEREETEAGDDD